MDQGITAGQWYKRRIAGQRVANRKGPESWAQSRGTEREFRLLDWRRAAADHLQRLQTTRLPSERMDTLASLSLQ